MEVTNGFPSGMDPNLVLWLVNAVLIMVLMIINGAPDFILSRVQHLRTSTSSRIEQALAEPKRQIQNFHDHLAAQQSVHQKQLTADRKKYADAIQNMTSAHTRDMNDLEKRLKDQFKGIFQKQANSIEHRIENCLASAHTAAMTASNHRITALENRSEEQANATNNRFANFENTLESHEVGTAGLQIAVSELEQGFKQEKEARQKETQARRRLERTQAEWNIQQQEFNEEQIKFNGKHELQITKITILNDTVSLRLEQLEKDAKEKAEQDEIRFQKLEQEAFDKAEENDCRFKELEKTDEAQEEMIEAFQKQQVETDKSLKDETTKNKALREQLDTIREQFDAQKLVTEKQFEDQTEQIAALREDHRLTQQKLGEQKAATAAIEQNNWISQSMADLEAPKKDVTSSRQDDRATVASIKTDFSAFKKTCDEEREGDRRNASQVSTDLEAIKANVGNITSEHEVIGRNVETLASSLRGDMGTLQTQQDEERGQIAKLQETSTSHENGLEQLMKDRDDDREANDRKASDVATEMTSVKFDVIKLKVNGEKITEIVATTTSLEAVTKQLEEDRAEVATASSELKTIKETVKDLQSSQKLADDKISGFEVAQFSLEKDVTGLEASIEKMTSERSNDIRDASERTQIKRLSNDLSKTDATVEEVQDQATKFVSDADANSRKVSEIDAKVNGVVAGLEQLKTTTSSQIEAVQKGLEEYQKKSVNYLSNLIAALRNDFEGHKSQHPNAGNAMVLYVPQDVQNPRGELAHYAQENFNHLFSAIQDHTKSIGDLRKSKDATNMQLLHITNQIQHLNSHMSLWSDAISGIDQRLAEFPVEISYVTPEEMKKLGNELFYRFLHISLPLDGGHMAPTSNGSTRGRRRQVPLLHWWPVDAQVQTDDMPPKDGDMSSMSDSTGAPNGLTDQQPDDAHDKGEQPELQVDDAASPKGDVLSKSSNEESAKQESKAQGKANKGKGKASIRQQDSVDAANTADIHDKASGFGSGSTPSAPAATSTPDAGVGSSLSNPGNSNASTPRLSWSAVAASPGQNLRASRFASQNIPGPPTPQTTEKTPGRTSGGNGGKKRYMSLEEFEKQQGLGNTNNTGLADINHNNNDGHGKKNNGCDNKIHGHGNKNHGQGNKKDGHGKKNHGHGGKDGPARGGQDGPPQA
ncbi:hypothetical protein BU23DRAFT_565611 [Bimuria novae-zelandiae CBS 107.79]|uniref:Uncharacterized protein n=1 Tax=Bimuria novae-zelandiae CBS 107.79 TaxID=1447943 RepID=A0A6A5VUQ5_9PLEO|nr:hypothetical protein BU23DRAFT_565611 [Bimuria novae-zelandiae CBS 107.79]